jgi:hypothetical protein
MSRDQIIQQTLDTNRNNYYYSQLEEKGELVHTNNTYQKEDAQKINIDKSNKESYNKPTKTLIIE